MHIQVNLKGKFFFFVRIDIERKCDGEFGLVQFSKLIIVNIFLIMAGLMCVVVLSLSQK